LTLPDSTRPRILLGGPELSQARAEEKKNAYLERIQQKTFVGTTPAGAAPPSKAAQTTVRTLAKRWTSGELFEEYGPVNKLRPKASAKIDAWTLEKHAFNVRTRGPKEVAFGDLLIGDVSDDDCATVMASQPRDQASQTRTHTYQRLRRLFDLAIYPCKLRPEGSNPVSRYLRPEKDPEKLYCYLYPAEVLALLDAESIPIGRRVLYAIAFYTGLRKSSIYPLRWSGIDFTHGTITAYWMKGRARLGRGRAPKDAPVAGRPVIFHADPSLMAVLKVWYEFCGRPDKAEAVVRDVGFERSHDEAQVLRADLGAVGVDREVLFSDAPNVEPLRFHDTRATFVTWAKRAGKTDAWISERTGHLTRQMIDRYTRAAQTLADLNYEPFPTMDELVGALTAGCTTGTATPDASNSSSTLEGASERGSEERGAAANDAPGASRGSRAARRRASRAPRESHVAAVAQQSTAAAHIAGTELAFDDVPSDESSPNRPQSLLGALADEVANDEISEEEQELVRRAGLEPARCYPLAPQASASANSATFASGVRATQPTHTAGGVKQIRGVGSSPAFPVARSQEPAPQALTLRLRDSLEPILEPRLRHPVGETSHFPLEPRVLLPSEQAPAGQPAELRARRSPQRQHPRPHLGLRVRPHLR